MAIRSSDLLTFSLRTAPQGESITRIVSAALQAVNPEDAVRRFMQRHGNKLEVGNQKYDLDRFERVYLVGAGKASAPMAEAAVEIIGANLTEGLIITKEGYRKAKALTRCLIFEAGHPIPDLRGVMATRRILSLLEQVRESDLVICLLSGGGSALLNCPSEGISLQDMQALTGELLACGANIDEINTLRKHLDNIKGGGLCKKAAPATVVSLILSDVVGDPLDRIASGPTAPDPSTYTDAYSILNRYDLVKRTPQTIVDHIRLGIQKQIPETPKPGDPIFSKVLNQIVGNNYLAAKAAAQQAAQEGMNALILSTCLQGEASQAGLLLASIAQQVVKTGEPVPRPACIVAGGETTVILHGDGTGGRNQEMALAAVLPFAGLPDAFLVTLATDGGDGPTDAAGAVVTGGTFERASLAGLDPRDFLRQNDSYHFFHQLDDLLKPGPTLTNVNDLAFIFTF